MNSDAVLVSIFASLVLILVFALSKLYRSLSATSSPLPHRISEIELWAVKGELDLARKTIDHYKHLVTKLYDELDTLHNGICNTCNTKFIPGSTSSSSAGRDSSSPTPTSRFIPFWGRVFQGGRPAPHQTSVAISDIRSIETFTQQTSIELTLIPSSLHPQTSVGVDNIPYSKPDEADWSVVHNHQLRQTLDIHLTHTLKMRSEVICVRFSRDGKYLAVGLRSGGTYIYDMKTLSYRILTIVEYPPKKQPAIWAMKFSPDDKYIATGAYDNQIRVWSLAERRVLATLKGHTSIVLSVDFSPNGRFLLSCSFDGSVRIWRVRDGSSRKLLDPKMSSVTSAAISPDGRYVAAGDSSGFLRIWDFRSGGLLQRWVAGGCLWSVVFTSDGKGLLSGGAGKTLRSWDISSLVDSQSGSRRRALVTDGGKECLSFHGHTGSIISVSIFHDSRWVLSASDDSTVRIWDVWTGAWQCTLSGHKAKATADASPDRRHLATGSDDRSVRVWRYESYEPAGLAYDRGL